MSKESPSTDPLPSTCPVCTAKVKTAGNIFDQKKAVALKLVATLILGASTMVGIMILWFVVGRISLQLVLVVVGISLIPSGIVFAWANAILKIKEVKCTKCRWVEYFYIQVRNPGG